MSGCNCHCNNNTTLSKELLDFINECNAKEQSESYLIAVLHKVQEKYGYLSKDHMNEVAQLLQVPAAFVSGVATFYHFFRLEPKGKFSISICQGTACFVKGADKIIEAFKSELGIDLGETTSDGLFSLISTRCLGVCAMAPVVMINEEVFSNVKPNQVSEIINKVKDKA